MGSRVTEVNLEYGMPKVEDAIRNMNNALVSQKRMGAKAVILIHGYGSTGVGGNIKPAVGRALSQPSMRGIVKAYVPGESWYSKRKEMLALCRELKDYEGRINGNDGITVVVLR
jgi:DNA-nicking Smr family endonuclease